MNTLSRLCVILALLFGVMAAFPILWLYSSFVQSHGIQFPETQPSIVKTIAETENIESLRRVCSFLAVSADNDTIIRQANKKMLDKMKWGGIAILLGWCAIAGFLYVARQLHKLSKQSDLEKKHAL